MWLCVCFVILADRGAWPAPPRGQSWPRLCVPLLFRREEGLGQPLRGPPRQPRLCVRVAAGGTLAAALGLSPAVARVGVLLHGGGPQA